MDLARFEKLSPEQWRIRAHGAMRVPVVIYASEALMRAMDDKVGEQAMNVASLPGIVGASYAMPARPTPREWPRFSAVGCS